MYDSKKHRVSKPLSKPPGSRHISGMLRGSSGSHGMRSDSRGNVSTGATVATPSKGYDHSLGFQGLDQAKVNCNSYHSFLVLSSSTVAARGGHPETYEGSTGITGHSIPGTNFLDNERFAPATGGSGLPSKKQRMKMLNMSKINGPAATSFYYPQSTRAGSKTGPSNNSLLGSSPGGLGLLSSTLKTAVSGKALFPEDNRTSPVRTSATQANPMVPPRGISGNSKFSAKIGNSSITYSDLSGLHYRYQSPAQAASKINSSVTNATLNIGKPGKYPPLETTTQRILQTPKSSGQRLMSGGFSNSGKS